MPGFLRRFLDRLSERVDRSARGTAVPAGTEPPVPGEKPVPTARERSLMRRRLRTLRRRREALMMEVGGEVLESRRSSDSARLDDKTAELEQVDHEARVLAEALDELKTLDEVLASGVARRCPSCGELVANRDSYCSACGTPLKGARPATPEAPGSPRQPARVSGRTGATTAAATGHGPSGGGSAPPPTA
jgi:zinc-ribbon domain